MWKGGMTNPIYLNCQGKGEAGGEGDCGDGEARRGAQAQGAGEGKAAGSDGGGAIDPH